MAAIDYGQLIQSVEDVAPEYAEMAKKLGIKGLVSLCEHYGGRQIYVPSTYTIAKAGLVERASADYRSGMSADEIAVKYGISRITAYTLLRDAIREQRRAPIDGQIGLFDNNKF